MLKLLTLLLTAVLSVRAEAESRKKEGSAPAPLIPGQAMPAPPAGMPQMPKDPAKMQEWMREQMSKDHERRMEDFKKSDPEGFQAQTAEMERHQKVQAVISRLREGKLAKPEAQRQLAGLLKGSTDAESEGVDERIAELEKELSFLKKAKKDPDLFLQRKAERMLEGNASPGPGMAGSGGWGPPPTMPFGGPGGMQPPAGMQPPGGMPPPPPGM